MTPQQYDAFKLCIRTNLTDPVRIRELKDAIANHEVLLRDCLDRKPSLALRQISESWEGTAVIDFDYVARLIRYWLEDERDDLWKCERAATAIAQEVDFGK